MPVEMGVWRLDGNTPRRLPRGVLPSEAELEDFLERDPSLLGEKLLVIGRQLRTPHGKLIDLLSIDEDGNLNVLELKRDKTPRDVVAQVLDYGSWVAHLDRDTITDIAQAHLNTQLEEAFDEVFDAPLPDELNNETRMTIVATELDESSERIVTFLRQFGLPINAVFFSYFIDEGRSYLGRSWLASSQQTGAAPAARNRSKRAEWNGRDWFVTFGESSTRSWDDARKYGFVSAGGGEWYSRTLKNLPTGARIFVQIPKCGYVAVGETLAEAQPFDEALVHYQGKWTPLKDLDLSADYQHPGNDAHLPEDSEFIVPVRWITSRPKSRAYWEKGMFANQNSAGKLRQQYTLDRLAAHFALETASAATS
ncbi:endonuclease NucS domain-containing protein [Nesterenkonia haasae]|uniref:endonuclease NucS domain-containing protein n=1 Tax=Nesterenkonia haasae TaxID=2587813 RepID=UPI001390E058|nr:endonuclease NucS domain-containing protein [Nesterenkonia haasae]NDK32509.1 DUF91 domain-containing protein [Nesterenkonia haasae]